MRLSASGHCSCVLDVVLVLTDPRRESSTFSRNATLLHKRSKQTVTQPTHLHNLQQSLQSFAADFCGFQHASWFISSWLNSNNLTLSLHEADPRSFAVDSCGGQHANLTVTMCCRRAKGQTCCTSGSTQAFCHFQLKLISGVLQSTPVVVSMPI